MELAKLQDGQLIYGTYEECEEYADKENTCVDRYFDHINPSTVYKNFKYIGNELSNPYKVSTPFDYSKGLPPATFNDAGVNQDKW
tara:strand:+ start:3263 stop:3517 length:255 start_codon:yes stop_codon:yes gene_type:complete